MGNPSEKRPSRTPSEAATVALYETPGHALRAAFAAAKAPLYGTSRVHPSNQGMNGRTGYGWWTDRDKAEVIAAGLRLTGYEVVILPGYSVGVVILDAQVPRGLHARLRAVPTLPAL